MPEFVPESRGHRRTAFSQVPEFVAAQAFPWRRTRLRPSAARSPPGPMWHRVPARRHLAAIQQARRGAEAGARGGEGSRPQARPPPGGDGGDGRPAGSVADNRGSRRVDGGCRLVLTGPGRSPAADRRPPGDLPAHAHLPAADGADERPVVPDGAARPRARPQPDRAAAASQHGLLHDRHHRAVLRPPRKFDGVGPCGCLHGGSANGASRSTR